MTKYLRMYLAMYVVFIAVVALVYALTGFNGSLEFLVPGLLAAVVGMSYAKDHLQTPSNRQRAHFALLAALVSSLVAAGLFAFGVAVQRSRYEGSSAQRRRRSLA